MSRSCNTLNDLLLNKLCVPNETEELNLSAFNMITEIIYHANVNIKLMLKNVIQIKCGITINVDLSLKM